MDAFGHDDSDVPAHTLLVRDFVNTVEWQVDHDTWGQPDDLEAWFRGRAGIAVGELREDDLLQAKQLREGLRSVLLTHAGHDPVPAALGQLNRALREVPVQLQFGSDGEPALRADGPGIREPLARILEAITLAQADGSWARLKACGRDSCRWAYWDRSRNHSARWCSMAGCGSVIKQRRHRGTPEPLVGDNGRAPTVVDVAGRAGVSIKTVSNVVNGAPHVREATRERVERAIAELGYRPNLAARALRAAR